MEVMAVEPDPPSGPAPHCWPPPWWPCCSTRVVSVAGIAGGCSSASTPSTSRSSSFFATFSELSQLADLAMALFKAAVFGFIAAMVACYKGLYAKGGPKGVGDAVNQAVVITFILAFFVNFVLTIVYFNFIPQKGDLTMAARRQTWCCRVSIRCSTSSGFDVLDHRSRSPAVGRCAAPQVPPRSRR